MEHFKTDTEKSVTQFFSPRHAQRATNCSASSARHTRSMFHPHKKLAEIRKEFAVIMLERTVEYLDRKSDFFASELALPVSNTGPVVSAAAVLRQRLDA